MKLTFVCLLIINFNFASKGPDFFSFLLKLKVEHLFVQFLFVYRAENVYFL